MKALFNTWINRYFSDPQAIILALLLIGGFGIIIVWGNRLAPVLASVVIAYLLEGLVSPLEKVRIPRLLAVLVVFSLFMAFLVFMVLGILPLVSHQVTQLFQEIPTMITQGQRSLLRLPELYPNFISEAQIRDIMAAIRAEITTFGQTVLSFSIASVSSVITVVVYLVLMPVLVFFFLKDKAVIINWIVQYLPKNRRLATRIWREMDLQIGNYVRGKFWEILLVGVVSYATFTFMGLQYALLLGLLVGLSVIIPYIGAVIVSFPVVLIAFFQWGWTAQFGWLVVAYMIIQVLDGNLLVPLLFSEAVNLHPVAIIVAVLFFGGLWGFWGIFFAIPLATLVRALLHAWPRVPDSSQSTVEEVQTNKVNKVAS